MATQFYNLIAIGGSAGSFKVVTRLLKQLPADYSIPIVVVLHVWKNSRGVVADTLNQVSHLTVQEAEEKTAPASGHVYMAPGGFHLLLERNRTFSLNIDPPVNYSRPSIDVLFQTASEAYGNSLAGVLLTGANSDGALGLKAIGDAGGMVIVQDPKTAEAPFMPASAMEITGVDHVINPESLAPLLQEISKLAESHHGKLSKH